jgi:sulfite oxidase
MLEKYRIGNLKRDASKANSNANDPFKNDPKRHPLLKVLTLKPFNAETPKEFAVENMITPNDLHFVRNHLPVPIVDVEKFQLEVGE